MDIELGSVFSWSAFPAKLMLTLSHNDKHKIIYSIFFSDQDKVVSFSGTETNVIWPHIKKYLEEKTEV